MYGLGQGILHEQAALQQAYEECRALRIPGTVCTPPPPLPQLLPELATTATPPLSLLWLALGALFLLGGRK